MGYMKKMWAEELLAGSGYEPTTRYSILEKAGSNFLKQGYIDGFIAGFTHKLTGGD